VPDPFAYLEHGDIFVLPSIEEGSGSVSLLEAMQAGLAPVVSNVDGLPEDVTEGDNGLLVRPGDVEDLARQLKRLLTDTALRERLAAGARTTFEQRFSAGAFSADLKRVFTQFGFEPSSD
jgi:glycosyltransferase involved in cell wall biosynthesis